MTDPNAAPRVLGEGKYLRLVAEGGWEYATRPHVTGIVVIVAITDDGKLVLVEQPRRAVHKRVIELPAGMVGDVDARTSRWSTAAHRELIEETGFEAGEIVDAGRRPHRRGRQRRDHLVLRGAPPEAGRPGRRRRARGHHRARGPAGRPAHASWPSSRPPDGRSTPKSTPGFFWPAWRCRDDHRPERPVRPAGVHPARGRARNGDLGVQGPARALQPERRPARRRGDGAAGHGHGPRRRRAGGAATGCSTPPRR